MLVYIIDAFNLLHKIPKLRKSASPHQELINYIRVNKLTGSFNNKGILVFDGYPNAGQLYNCDFKILFSCDKTADEVIKKTILQVKAKTELRVVSDDRELKDFAKGQGAVSVGNAEFLKLHRLQQGEDNGKHISYIVAKEITDELRGIWLKE